MTTEAKVRLGDRASSETDEILRWPDPFVGALRARLSALHARTALGADELADLRARGLIQTNADAPTPLGEYLLDLLVREEWQEGDEFASLLRDAVPGPGAAILEVGCSTGRRLRRLDALSPGLRCGVDTDARAVALGCRLAHQENQPVEFYCCDATALPFPDASFDLVICRNALTYMHQRTALTEMTRVLRPGGALFLRIENLRYDLYGLRHAGGVMPFLVRARNFAAGLLLASTGLQPRPGGACGWRAFATQRRLRKVLHRTGCEIVRVEEAQNCPRFLGRSTQTALLVKKPLARPARSEPARKSAPEPSLVS